MKHSEKERMKNSNFGNNANMMTSMDAPESLIRSSKRATKIHIRTMAREHIIYDTMSTLKHSEKERMKNSNFGNTATMMTSMGATESP